MATSLRKLESFGDVAAEDDAVLDYFLATDAVAQIERKQAFLVLGRPAGWAGHSANHAKRARVSQQRRRVGQSVAPS